MKSNKAQVVMMPGAKPRAGKKTVAATQKAIDELPLASGDWNVAGVPGLVVRCGRREKTYRIQRRIHGRLVTRVLGAMTLAAARRFAMKEWAALRPKPPEGAMTLSEAWQAYLDEKQLAPKTRQLYIENLARYLTDWRNRTLQQIGSDRAGVRTLYQRLVKNHGLAIGAQVIRQLGAVYRYFRRVIDGLPDCPTEVVEVVNVKPRDWALSDEELRVWWAAVQRLRPLKRTLWLTLLLTGARRDSVRLLRWQDVDLERKVIRFSTAKAGRTYSIPMSDRLAAILREWREQAVPGEWVFESPQKPGRPLSPQVRDDKRGVVSAHHLRHTMRTRLVELGVTPDLARIILGHSLAGDVSRGYISPGLLVEAAREPLNRVAGRYAEVLGL